MEGETPALAGVTTLAEASDVKLSKSDVFFDPVPFARIDFFWAGSVAPARGRVQRHDWAHLNGFIPRPPFLLPGKLLPMMARFEGLAHSWLRLTEDLERAEAL